MSSIDAPLSGSEASRVVLILSADAIPAALLAAMVETLGYTVRFVRAPSYADDAMRRIRPKVCLVNCDEPDMCSGEILGRATMRRIPVVIFGSTVALEQVRALVAHHDLQRLLMPATVDEIEEVFLRALAS